ncbi:MAG TPA: DUF896 domain-containing protein [Firmicutes bacterium]|nr:DUF896 domain-containing protein [Bacillota bacterium]
MSPHRKAGRLYCPICHRFLLRKSYKKRPGCHRRVRRPVCACGSKRGPWNGAKTGAGLIPTASRRRDGKARNFVEAKLIERINELARKQRAEGLTDEEKKEQQALRAQYLQAWRQNLQTQLDNMVIVEPDGTRRPLQRKPKKEGH